ncbi:hypothetical protein TWF696_004033 [Orbilia brochopaga]|uniref:Uncharacterized protein n=1 Tax=Orbilia brochopaga TaxID=3140254 RepID=A0AAV9V7L4_9PEZI
MSVLVHQSFHEPCSSAFMKKLFFERKRGRYGGCGQLGLCITNASSTGASDIVSENLIASNQLGTSYLQMESQDFASYGSYSIAPSRRRRILHVLSNVHLRASFH